ncbi:F-box protein CPR1-like [Lotus japonicus]|uniref:F-box protein CPR1-like n=1 Tax=Lotus japonicus TaxID=34305 RepID=UPI0025906019|nr:F-box protein CPR1-like [Lotus japonicus]
MKNPRDDAIFPLDLLMEILSWLPVKTLIRFACISKSLKSLIFNDPSFAKLHLNRSPKNTHILLNIEDEPYEFENEDSWVVPCSVDCLMEDPSSMIDVEECYFLKGNHLVIGSCNGLVCLGNFYDVGPIEEFWVQLWNPSTHLMSKKSPTFHLSMRTSMDAPRGKVNLGFGYDSSHDTYKVSKYLKCYPFEDNYLRIHNSGGGALGLYRAENYDKGVLSVKNMKGPEYQWDNVTLEQLIIASFDMIEEVYTYRPLPEGVTEVPHFEPRLGVLENHMCLFHDHNRTHLVVWKMREYGVRESWTRWVKISYENLRCEGFLYRPSTMVLSEDGDILLLAKNGDLEFITYDIRDNNIEYISNPNKEFWLYAFGYVQSLVSPCQDKEDGQKRGRK